MPDAYTYVPKPTDATYININPQGKEQYDQASLTYDDANTFYDGTDQNAYTNVAKPTGGTSSTLAGGFATGLLIPLTKSSVFTIKNDPYTYISKPIT